MVCYVMKENQRKVIQVFVIHFWYFLHNLYITAEMPQQREIYLGLLTIFLRYSCPQPSSPEQQSDHHCNIYQSLF